MCMNKGIRTKDFLNGTNIYKMIKINRAKLNKNQIA